jgi:hypothetical protein
MNTKTKEIIRWLSILPLSFITSILIYFPIHIILYLTLMYGDFIHCEVYPKLPEILISSFLSPFTFIYTAYRIAPKHKLTTLIVVFSIFVVWTICIFFFVKEYLRLKEINFNYNGFQTISLYLGLISGFVFCYRDYKNNYYL